MTARAPLAAALLAALAVAAPARADTTTAGTLRLAPIGTFALPTYVTSPPGDPSRIFVVEQGDETSTPARPSRIRLVHDGVESTFADLSVRVSAGGERGLHSIAFAPDYATSGLLYAQYTAKPDGTVRIEELRRSADPNVANPAYARTVIEQSHGSAGYHNGGQLQFGPDGYLYASIGDGGDTPDEAQDLANLLGKVIRISPAGGAAPGNPFAGRSGARPEIYMYGLRNPWRFSFDALTGDLVIGDVGQSTREEVDFFNQGQGAGKDLGWPRWEGDLEHTDKPPLDPTDPYAPPVLTYGTHVNGTCAVTGGYVVRDRQLGELLGRYLYADYCQGVLRSAQLSAAGATGGAPVGDAAAPLSVPGVQTFGQDALCHVYVASGGGAVYRLESTAPVASPGCEAPPPAPGSPPGPAPTPPAAEPPAGLATRATAPAISRLAMLRRRFRVSAGTTALSARAAGAPGRGTAFRYTLSEPARVSFRIERLLPGRRVGRRCLAPTPTRRGRPACTRARWRGTLTRSVRAGRRSTPFSGRIARRALEPGRYRATLRATDSAGDVSRGRAITFTVAAG